MKLTAENLNHGEHGEHGEKPEEDIQIANIPFSFPLPFPVLPVV
jgi:hypothetical protein